MIFDIGVSSYEQCYALQRDLVSRRIASVIGNTAIVTEHENVFTIGRSGSEKNLLIDKARLAKENIRVLLVDRGGDITYHGPGQIVLYPIVDLKERGRDLHRYLRDLEEIVISFLLIYGISAEQVKGKTGVWVGRKKIASIGIAVRGWVAYHGVSINVDVDPRFFSMIHPCGMKDVKVVSLCDVLNRKIDVSGAKNALIAAACKRLNIEPNSVSYIKEIVHD